MGACGFVPWSINTGNLDYGIWLWNCLYLLNFMKLLEDGGKRHAAFSALFAVLATLTNFVNLMMLALFSAVLLAFHLSRLTRRHLACLAALCAAILLALAPLLIGFAAENRGRSYRETIERTGSGQARPEAFAPYHDSVPLLFYMPWQKGGRGQGKTTNYFVVLALAGASLFFRRKEALPWLAAAGFFFVMSLGPYLKLASDAPPGPEAEPLALPYLLFHQIVPFFYRVQFPSRMFAFALLPLTVAAGLGVQAPAWLKGHKARAAAVTALTLALLLEMGVAWQLRPRRKPAVHSFYQGLAAQETPTALIELPFNFDKLDGDYVYYQTRHGKPLFNGLFPPFFTQDPTNGLAGGNLFLREAIRLQEPLFVDDPHLARPWIDIVEPRHDTVEESVAELAGKGFAFVVLHKTIIPTRRGLTWRHEELQRFLNRTLGPPTFDDDELAVYAVSGE